MPFSVGKRACLGEGMHAACQPALTKQRTTQVLLAWKCTYLLVRVCSVEFEGTSQVASKEHMLFSVCRANII